MFRVIDELEVGFGALRCASRLCCANSCATGCLASGRMPFQCCSFPVAGVVDAVLLSLLPHVSVVVGSWSLSPFISGVSGRGTCVSHGGGGMPAAVIIGGSGMVVVSSSWVRMLAVKFFNTGCVLNLIQRFRLELVLA